MLLADLGAEVICICRPDVSSIALCRNRPIVEVDLKSTGGRVTALDLIERVDVLIEGFRPGVMERLRLGPTEVHARNPSLIYARITGWGQTGPLARTAGHDINYIALTGALHVSTRASVAPTPPANLLGDFAGGGYYAMISILTAILERQETRTGKVLDIAIVDGTTYLTSMLHEYRAEGRWSDSAGTNRLDTGAPFYDVYRCRDGRFLAVGALEDKFFAELVDVLGLPADLALTRHDPATWPDLRARVAEAVAHRTQAEWVELAGRRDSCLAPVLNLSEAPRHPHMLHREVFRKRPDQAGWDPQVPLGFRQNPEDYRELQQRWKQSVSPFSPTGNTDRIHQ